MEYGGPIRARVWKENTIELAKWHREHCHEACSVSLLLLREMAEFTGIKFTEEELKNFL